jgi:hypothetical protein
VGADGSRTISLTYTFDSCGYFQLDVWAPWKGSDNGRVACDSRVGLRPHPRLRRPVVHSNADPDTFGGGAAGGTPTPTTTPTSGVQGITTSVPSKGAGSGTLAVRAALVIAGAGTLAVAARRRIGLGDVQETF